MKKAKKKTANEQVADTITATLNKDGHDIVILGKMKTAIQDHQSYTSIHNASTRFVGTALDALDLSAEKLGLRFKIKTFVIVEEAPPNGSV